MGPKSMDSIWVLRMSREFRKSLLFGKPGTHLVGLRYLHHRVSWEKCYHGGTLDGIAKRKLSSRSIQASARQHGQIRFHCFLQGCSYRIERKKTVGDLGWVTRTQGAYCDRLHTSQKSWLRVERYPAYAPELSPVELLWSPMKTKDFAHLPPHGLPYLKRKIRQSFRRSRRQNVIEKLFT